MLLNTLYQDAVFLNQYIGYNGKVMKDTLNLKGADIP